MVGQPHHLSDPLSFHVFNLHDSLFTLLYYNWFGQRGYSIVSYMGHHKSMFLHSRSSNHLTHMSIAPGGGNWSPPLSSQVSHQGTISSNVVNSPLLASIVRPFFSLIYIYIHLLICLFVYYYYYYPRISQRAWPNPSFANLLIYLMKWTTSMGSCIVW